MSESGKRQRRLSDGYSFAGFRACESVRGVFGDPDVRIVRLDRCSKKRFAAAAVASRWAGTIAGYGGSRSVERRVPDRSGVGGAAHRVRRLRLREARAAGFSGGQSSLHQALCLLCRASLPAGRDPRCRQGAKARLGNSQDARDAVHAGADRTGGRAGTQGDRRRRDLDSQGPRLSHRGQRSGAQEADLVRRRRPFRDEHGAVLRLAGATEVQQNQARRDGHVETVPQRREGKGAASRDPVRQVPHHAPSRRGARQGAQGRIRPPRRQGSALHQRPEVHAAVASREPHPGGQALARTPAGRQQAPQYRLRPERVVRPTMGLPARELGAPLLRQLARQPQMAAPQTLPALRRHDRSALGRNRRLLQTGEQGFSRLRRGPQQQDPRVSATRLRTERRGISPPQGPLLHAPAALTPQNRPLDFQKTPFCSAKRRKTSPKSRRTWIYGRAYQLVNIPTEQLHLAVSEMGFAAFSRLQDDPVRLKSYFLKGFSLFLGLALPITLVCILFADELAFVVLGPKWNDAAAIIRLRAPAIAIFAIINPLEWLMFSTGPGARSLKIALVFAPFMITGYLIGLPYGPKGVAFC